MDGIYVYTEGTRDRYVVSYVWHGKLYALTVCRSYRLMVAQVIQYRMRYHSPVHFDYYHYR